MTVFVYGFPGLYAGANTELHHQIILWRSMGLSIHLIPSDRGYRNEALYPEMLDRGVTVHEADDFDAITPGSPVLGFLQRSVPELTSTASSNARTTRSSSTA